MHTLRNRLHQKTNWFLFTALALSLLVAAPRGQQITTKPQQSPEERIALYQALLDLTNPWTVMCVAAHPDDEDGTSLIVMRRKYGAHTVSLFTTFGEGGQNAIGPELYEEMGAIRARETMAASEIQGSEPHFLGLKDFGFSKTADETLRFWGQDEALRRMVLQIRKLRPDVIITNHDTGGGHGHHQVTGRAVVEAFDAAADPKRFPEQLKDGIKTWQVQRLFVRSRGAAGDASIVTIDPNERDPVRGTVYAEEALRALQQHATQGPWPKTFAERVRNSPDGKLPLVRYRLAREAKGAAALPNAPQNFVDGLQLPEAGGKVLAPNVGQPLTRIIDNRPAVLDALLAWKKNERAAGVESQYLGPRVERQRRLIDQAIASAAGLEISMSPENAIVAPGTSKVFSVTVSNHGNLRPWIIATHSYAGDRRVELGVNINKSPRQILPGKSETLNLTYSAPANGPITVPHHAHLYNGNLFSQMATVHALLKIEDVAVGIEASTQFDVAAPVEIAEITPSPVVLTTQGSKTEGTPPTRFPITATLINRQTIPFQGSLIAINSLADSRSDSVPVTLSPGERRVITMQIEAPTAIGSDLRYSLTLMLQNAKTTSPSKTVSVISTSATTSSGVRVGYVRGFDFSLPNALTALGVESKELSVNDVKTADLSKYTSVIVDNRVYESQPELIAANQKLLDFAKAGGNLIVFYHKSDEWNPDGRRNRPELAPYKLILGNARITDENAPITFIEPEHPLLNVPNKLNQDDFKDWIQERGLYYPREWDPQFRALLQSNDPGEAPLKGGLLVADYGKGHYIYSSMVWYRQLRAGVPGAYRMLANMISYGRTN